MQDATAPCDSVSCVPRLSIPRRTGARNTEETARIAEASPERAVLQVVAGVRFGPTGEISSRAPPSVSRYPCLLVNWTSSQACLRAPQRDGQPDEGGTG